MKKAIIDTYERASKEWFPNVEMYAELVIALNHKIWDLYETNEDLARLYNELWQKADQKAEDYDKKNANVYYRITD